MWSFKEGVHFFMWLANFSKNVSNLKNVILEPYHMLEMQQANHHILWLAPCFN